MKNFWKVGIVGALLLFVTTTWAQDDKFKVYGFADFSFNQWITLSDSTFLNGFGEKAPSVNLGNVNLYFDMKPNDNTRALIEVNLNTSQFDEGEKGITNQKMMIRNPATGEFIIAQEVEGTGDERAKKYGGIQLERAWFDLFMLPTVNLRIGKFITPAGIWNVDHGSPIITTVGQPNQTRFFAIFPESQTGAMLYGAYYIGDHELTYNLFTSGGRNDVNSILGASEVQEMEKLSDLAVGGHVAFAAEEIIDELKVGVSGYTGVIQDEIRILEQNIVLDGTTFAPTGEVRFAYLDKMNYSLREFCYGVDLKASHMNVNFQSEVNMRTVESEFGPSSGKSTSFLGYYFLLSYDLALLDFMGVTPYAMYEHIGWEDPNNVPEFLAVDSSPIEGWNSILLGLNFSFYTNYRIKVEYTMGSLLMRSETDYPGSVFDYGNSSDDAQFSTFAVQFSMAF